MANTKDSGDKKSMKEQAKPHFITTVFASLALVLLISQIPVWVAPGKSLDVASGDNKPICDSNEGCLRRLQELFFWTTGTINVVFLSLVSLYTAARPHRLLIMMFAGLSLFYIIETSYKIREVEASSGVIATLIINLVFFFLCLYAIVMVPTIPFPKDVHPFVRFSFFASGAILGIRGFLDVVAPEKMLDTYLTDLPEYTSHMELWLTFNGFMTCFLGLTALFCAIKPERNLTVLFVAFFFVQMVVIAYAIENEEYYSFEYNGAVVWETVLVVLFVCSIIGTYLAPAGTSNYKELQEARV